MNLNDLFKKISLTTYLKRRYLEFCNELGIGELEAKRLKKVDKGLFRAEDVNLIKTNKSTNYDKDLKYHILHCYACLLLENLRLSSKHIYKFSGAIYIDNSKCFNWYTDNHYKDLCILIQLLTDDYYKYRGFLIQNLLYLRESLEVPFIQLDNICKLDMTAVERETEQIALETEICKVFDSFLEVVSKLHDEYQFELKSKKPQIINSGVLDNLKSYTILLNNIKLDMKECKGIF